MASPKHGTTVPRLTDEMIVTRPLAAALIIGAGIGAAALVGGLGDAVAQSKQGIVIQANPPDPDKPASKWGAMAVNPPDPDKLARKRGAVAINPPDPDKLARKRGAVATNPPDPDMPAWARELFGGSGGGGGGGGR